MSHLFARGAGACARTEASLISQGVVRDVKDLRGTIMDASVSSLMAPGTDGGLNNPHPLPGTHDHNLNLALVSHGTTAHRERRVLYRDYDNNGMPAPMGSPALSSLL